MNDVNDFATELFRIVSGALRLDVVKVRNYCTFLADKLEKAGETATAVRLRKLLEETDQQLRPADFRAAPSVPVDTETRFPLIEKVDQKKSNDILILTQEQQDLVSEFISIAKSQGRLESEGIPVQTSLLIYGPPGCGKSSLATYIAKELQLPLYLARIDGLISSFLGNTAKNIRAVFEFVSKGPCVLLLDEFDAIAKIRDDKQELGELKRVVNSFLQNLDSLGSENIIIAATNHQQLLDPAVWRRFSYTLSLSFPNEDQREKIWDIYLRPHGFTPHDLELFTDLSDGFSGAEIREVCTRLKRQSVVHSTQPGVEDVFVGLKRAAIADPNRARFLAHACSLDNHGLAATLRKRNSKLYSHAAIGSLLGVSKATSFRLSTRVKPNGKKSKN